MPFETEEYTANVKKARARVMKDFNATKSGKYLPLSYDADMIREHFD